MQRLGTTHHVYGTSCGVKNRGQYLLAPGQRDVNLMSAGGCVSTSNLCFVFSLIIFLLFFCGVVVVVVGGRGVARNGFRVNNIFITNASSVKIRLAKSRLVRNYEQLNFRNR